MGFTPLPALGDVVIYRSVAGDYDAPAIVSATETALREPGSPKLSGDRHLHLAVLSPVRGYLTRFDVPQASARIKPGTWRWP